MMGMCGARLRMRLAIGCVNSGASMMTTASGSAATAAAAVRRTREMMRGSRGRIDNGPMTATSESGNCEASPSRSMSSPPTPR